MRITHLLHQVAFVNFISQDYERKVWFTVQDSASGSVSRVLFKIRPTASGSGFSVLFKIRPAASG